MADEVLRGVDEAGLTQALERHRGGEPIPDLVARFLKARGGDPKKALKLLLEDLKWREEHNIHLLRNMTASQVLQGDKFPGRKEKHDQIFRHGFLGYDKQGRPVIYKWYNKEYVIPFVEGLDTETLAQYNTWMVERLSDSMKDCGQWVIIIDLDIYSVRMACSGNLKYCKSVADVDSKHYPERLSFTNDHITVTAYKF